MEKGESRYTRPIRVLVFGGGPVLEPGVKRFIRLLEEHTGIDFLGAICESKSQTFQAILQDLWRRRGVIALPVLLLQIGRSAGRIIRHPSREMSTRRTISRLSVRIYFVPDIHDRSVHDQVRTLAPDLGLVYGSPILKPSLFQIPQMGTLGIHHGKVPEYRGKKTTFWAMYNGEQTAGVTIQKINAGLDTGEIVQQGQVPIGNRSFRSVWNDIEDLGFELYIQAIMDVKHGTASYQPQSGPKGKLYRDPTLADILTFWGKQIPKRFRLQG